MNDREAGSLEKRMSETNNSGDKSSGASAPKPTLHLKRPVEQGTVRQSFSHGRSKAVVVEKVKRRVLGPGETALAPVAPSVQKPVAPVVVAAPVVAPRGPTAAAAPPAPPKTGVVLRTLTEE